MDKILLKSIFDNLSREDIHSASSANSVLIGRILPFDQEVLKHDALIFYNALKDAVIYDQLNQLPETYTSQNSGTINNLLNNTALLENTITARKISLIRILNELSEESEFEVELLFQELKNIFSRYFSNSNVAQEKYYFALLDHFPSLVWKSGPDGKFDFVNKVWIEFTGKQPEFSKGEEWISYVHPEDKDIVLRKFIECFNARQIFEHEYRLQHYSGNYLWVYDVAKPFSDIHGNFAGYIGTSYDISERKIAEDGLKEKNEVIDSIINYLPVFLTRIDENGKVLDSIGAGLKKLGLKNRQVVGTNIFETLPAFSDKIKKALQGKQVSFIAQTEIDQKDIYFQNNFLFDRLSGKGAIGLHFDITEQKHIENELRNKKLVLESILNNLPVIVIRLDGNGMILEMRGKGLISLGLKEDEKFGMNLVQNNPEYAAHITKALNGSSSEFISEDYYGNEKKYFQNYFFFDDVRCEGAIGLLIDITDHKIAQDLLMESEHFIKQITEASPNLIYVYDLHKKEKYLLQQRYKKYSWFCR